jgi:hypothetical protein
VARSRCSRSPPSRSPATTRWPPPAASTRRSTPTASASCPTAATPRPFSPSATGNVVVAGSDAAGDFAVWRLKANGALDAIRFRLSEPARVRLRRLAAGRYRLTATARDAAGNAARPRRATFRLIHR